MRERTLGERPREAGPRLGEQLEGNTAIERNPFQQGLPGQIEKSKTLYSETQELDLSLNHEVTEGVIDELKGLVGKGIKPEEAKIVLTEVFSLPSIIPKIMSAT